MNTRIITGYQDTRTNNEDFALTPFLFLVHSKKYFLYGIGICWGYSSFHISIAKVPKEYPFFRILKRKNDKER